MQVSEMRRPKLLAAALCAAAITLMVALGSGTAFAEPATSAEALEELMAQQAKLDEASNRYFNSLTDYQKALVEYDAASQRLEQIEAELTTAQDRLSTRARELYRMGAASWIEVLLGSASFTDLTRNLDMLNLINENDAALIAEERELRAASREQQAVMEEQVLRTSHAADDAYKAYHEAEELTMQIQATYERLNAEEQAYIAQQAAIQAAEQEAAMAQQTADDEMVAEAIEESGGTVNDDGTITDADGTTYSSPSEYSAASGNDVVERALSQLGANYVWGGVGGSSGGFDCSGFVSYALTGENTRLGTTADFVTWNEVSDPQPGDVAVIHEANGNQHTGIYLGDGMMVHAADEKTGVVVSEVQDGMTFVRQ